MPQDTTPLSPADEARFQAWAQTNGLQDVDHPDSYYDYRGFWKSTSGAPHPPGSEQHFPDRFKQHGHPTFSQESQYSRGPSDGGMWLDDNFQAQPPLAVSHEARVPAPWIAHGGYGAPDDRRTSADWLAMARSGQVSTDWTESPAGKAWLGVPASVQALIDRLRK